ncbi:hypothetical protein MGG_07053 [Pyricularia oryzae 70-15]|uniref:Uncharacterized protein n=3 Tax=Pyricularia oryzae TaxID=318829 RepID=G4MZR1_PYRO7|nr:uncharacterized protein MGG_07053 [Pyricularia oryzae 70-15]EHA55425.1 hypothetical protein MGG_07053 [Pyricularia oryzae 70-15]ELQ35485.1 hypothetical protein OOU_Y34scaffold00707g69 [Pyricularia oryzae Y34]KAI7919265.1 hypothetical protein M0657_007175 [Pyricularia oryzae]KAI7925520.1 hypothetical protein M9X92_003294 [Pyricularia oryzae]
MRRRLCSTAAVTITDPLVKYQSLVQTGVYLPDPAQHRLALHLQKLYKRLKDYVPSPEYRSRLRQVTKAVEASSRSTVGDDLAAPGHPLRRNPLFARFFKPDGEAQASADAKALTRVLTNHQAALEADSPRGLFLSGEVGTGKSMLLDLLADGLPTRLKRRWHFNTFMLHAFSRLEQYRRQQGLSGGGAGDDATNYSLIWLAKEMVESSPILFLDEFQLPDRAASKLLSNLFIAFFQLGGVLVASSNRVPEELERASGVTFTPPAVGGLAHRLFVSMGAANPKRSGELFGSSSDFAAFLEVLKARCDFFHIEGTKDWRRRDDAPNLSDALAARQHHLPTIAEFSQAGAIGAVGDTAASQSSTNPEQESKSALPRKYFLSSESDGTNNMLLTSELASADWQAAELSVYGRRVLVPKQHEGVALWKFEDLVSSLGPADYITLASNYHTFIIDNVPVLPTSKKNEARRFITFLDALYEARCKLVVRAQAGPDDIFFPDMRPSKSSDTAGGNKDTVGPVEDGDATYSETVAEVYQDQLAPFRPNISTYESEARTSKYDPDQDSDFGLDDRHNSRAGMSPHGNRHAVNFADAGAFTGEDERFAYRRAASRLWELCSARWHAREEPGWWQPLPVEARHWEGRSVTKPMGPGTHLDHRIGLKTDAQMGSSIALDEPAGLERFRLAELRKASSESGN